MLLNLLSPDAFSAVKMVIKCVGGRRSAPNSAGELASWTKEREEGQRKEGVERGVGKRSARGKGGEGRKCKGGRRGEGDGCGLQIHQCPSSIIIIQFYCSISRIIFVFRRHMLPVHKSRSFRM